VSSCLCSFTWCVILCPRIYAASLGVGSRVVAQSARQPEHRPAAATTSLILPQIHSAPAQSAARQAMLALQSS